jgi:hypothetical protein
MLLFALAHSYAFSAREFWVEAGPGGTPPPRSVWANVSAVLDWSDVGHNMVGQVHFGASELLDGVSSAGSAVLGGAAWPFVKLQKQLAKARSSGGRVGGDGVAAGRGAPPSATASQRRAAREATEALLPAAPGE